MKKYLKVDFFRLFTSKSLILSVCGVILVYFTGWIEMPYCKDVFQILYYIKLYSICILMFAFSGVAYTNAILEDAEHKYWNLMVQKGKLRCYVWSKVIVCFCGAVAATVLGTLGFVLIARFRLPFLEPADFLIDGLSDVVCLSSLMTPNRVLFYFAMDGLLTGLLGGMLALFSMWLSLYVRNRMFSVCIPVVGFYFWDNYFGRIFGDLIYLNFNGIYLQNGRVFSNPILSVLYALILAVLVSVGFGTIILRKVQKEMRGEKK
jgi:hypothetical protein